MKISKERKKNWAKEWEKGWEAEYKKCKNNFLINGLEVCCLLAVVLAILILSYLSKSFFYQGKYLSGMFISFVLFSLIILNFKTVKYYISVIVLIDKNIYDFNDFRTNRILRAVLSLIIIFSFNKMIIFESTDVNEFISSQQIFSLESKDSITGNFVLGFKNIDNKNYYRFYIKDDDDFYTLKTIDVDENVKLKLNENNDRKIEVFNIMSHKKITILNDTIDDKKVFLKTLTIINIPSNSVKENFSL